MGLGGFWRRRRRHFIDQFHARKRAIVGDVDYCLNMALNPARSRRPLGQPEVIEPRTDLPLCFLIEREIRWSLFHSLSPLSGTHREGCEKHRPASVGNHFAGTTRLALDMVRVMVRSGEHVPCGAYHHLAAIIQLYPPFSPTSLHAAVADIVLGAVRWATVAEVFEPSTPLGRERGHD